MPGIHLGENFGDLYDSRFNKIFTTQYEENIKESMIPFLYGLATSTKNYEMFSAVSGGGDVAEFDGSLDYDTVEQLWDKTTYFNERAQGMKIERKLADDDLTGTMDKRPWQMAINTARTIEKMAADMFAGAFTGTGGIDGVALCSTAHPYSPTVTTTMSNSGSSTFSATSVEATRRLAHTSIFNANGELANVNYDTILATVANEEKAFELIESRGKVDTDNNNRNFHYGRYRLGIWDRLVSSYPWFMIDSKLAKLFFTAWTRIDTEFSKASNFDTFQALWAVYFRKAFANYDWRPIYGHNATS